MGCLEREVEKRKMRGENNGEKGMRKGGERERVTT